MLNFCQCSQKKRTGAASCAAPSCSDSDSEVRCPTPSPVRYRTIVPKLGTPGKPCSSWFPAGQQARANNRRNLRLFFCPVYNAPGKPERTIIRLPGFPGSKNEQSFGCPDFPACSTNKKTRARSSGFCPKFYLLSK